MQQAVSYLTFDKVVRFAKCPFCKSPIGTPCTSKEETGQPHKSRALSAIRFQKWFEELKVEVSKLPDHIKPFFDLRETNIDCWQQEFEVGLSPQESVQTNVEALY